MFPPRPSYIQFYPTIRCNLNCSFCFNQGLKQTGDMDLKDYTKMIQILIGHGVNAIDILGGEPTLHEDIVEMVTVAGAQGLKVSLSSNGSRISVAKKIMDRHGDSCALGISLNDYPMDHDLDTFLSEYTPIVKSLCRDTNGLAPQVESGLSKGIRRFSLIYPDIISGNTEDSLPFHKYYDFINSVRETVPAIEPVYCSGFLPDVETYPALDHVRCPAGVTKLGIMPDGSVYPCNLFFGFREFRLGNIVKDRFEKIWTSPKLDFFRTFRGNLCPKPDCELHSQCHGGCPAHGLKFSGRMDGPDRRCLLSFTPKRNAKQRSRGSSLPASPGLD